jgi:hypothetical protein
MSRSRRKTPIFGIAHSGSEKLDKKIWHGRWRASERIALANASPEAHVSVLEKQVSNVWSMAKDGRTYWPLKRQASSAERIADDRGQNRRERTSLKQRLIRKWMTK